MCEDNEWDEQKRNKTKKSSTTTAGSACLFSRGPPNASDGILPVIFSLFFFLHLCLNFHNPSRLPLLGEGCRTVVLSCSKSGFSIHALTYLLVLCASFGTDYIFQYFVAMYQAFLLDPPVLSIDSRLFRE